MAQEDVLDINSATTDSTLKPRAIRHGDKIHSLIDDGFVSKGLTGLVTNIATSSDDELSLAHVKWDNDTSSRVYLKTIAMITSLDAENLITQTSSGSK